ncbi:hypothetical protein HOY82DRAFT_615489 [Tuber indicum]|nr:hypothetical protein HOY82DRAFT_615489 [Tuber indicum]
MAILVSGSGGWFKFRLKLAVLYSPRVSHAIKVIVKVVSYLPADRSLRKRLRPKTPTPPASPKVNIIPIDVSSEKDTILYTKSLMDTNLDQLPLLHRAEPVDAMELPELIRDLGLKQILNLQGENGGTLRIGKFPTMFWPTSDPKRPVRPVLAAAGLAQAFLQTAWPDCGKAAFQNESLARSGHLTALVRVALRLEPAVANNFDRTAPGFLKPQPNWPDCGPMVWAMVWTDRLGLLWPIGSKARAMVAVRSGTTFSGFIGDGFGTSRKLSDAYIQLPEGRFPTVICEAGWAESLEDLMQDARLWLLHTDGETRIVIVISFMEKNLRTAVAFESLDPSCESTVDTADSKQTQQLFDLNQQSKLQHPLLRKILATLHIYKACEGVKILSNPVLQLCCHSYQGTRGTLD